MGMHFLDLFGVCQLVEVGVECGVLAPTISCGWAPRPHNQKSPRANPLCMPLMNTNHVGPHRASCTKCLRSIFPIFLNSYGGNGHFWQTIGHCWAQRPKDENSPRANPLCMPLANTIHIGLHGASCTKCLRSFFPHFFSFLWGFAQF